MIGHHHRRVNHQPQRHRDARQRINVQPDVKQPIGDDSRQDDCRQRHHHDGQVFPLPFGQPDKDEQDAQSHQ